MAGTSAAPPAATGSRPIPNAPTLPLDRDRRAGVERVIELSRWAVLVFAAVSNNFPGEPRVSTTAAVNLILGGWGLFTSAQPWRWCSAACREDAPRSPSSSWTWPLPARWCT